VPSLSITLLQLIPTLFHIVVLQEGNILQVSTHATYRASPAYRPFRYPRLLRRQLHPMRSAGRSPLLPHSPETPPHRVSSNNNPVLSLDRHCSRRVTCPSLRPAFRTVSLLRPTHHTDGRPRSNLWLLACPRDSPFPGTPVYRIRGMRIRRLFYRTDYG